MSPEKSWSLAVLHINHARTTLEIWLTIECQSKLVRLSWTFSKLEASQLTHIPIIGTHGKPVLYADLNSDGDLVFEFEIYRNEQFDFDYEFKHTVDREEFPFIVAKFGLRQDQPILWIIQQISDGGRGQDLERALTLNEIKNDLWTWVSYS